MLSESLSALCRTVSILVEEDDYLLARVDIRGSAFIAEAVPKTDDPLRSRIWPPMPGTLRPAHDNRDRTSARILLYKDTGIRFLQERICEKPLTEDEARDMATTLAGTLRNLHTRGFVVGYLGPESVCLSADGSPLLLAGVRGVPDSPFVAPEAQSSLPVDPRSDIFALGTLMFRSVAGTGDRQGQLEAWGRLSRPFSALVERMVADKPENRHPGMAALIQDLTRPAPEMPPVRSTPQPLFEEQRSEEAPPPAGGRRRGRRPGWLPFAAVAAVALASALFVLFSPSSGPSAGSVDEDTLRPPPPDTAETALPDSLPVSGGEAVPAAPLPSGTVLWVSNCTGRAGAASDFRSGPAAGFAQVYCSTGAGRRSGSILLLRRDAPGLPIEGQRWWQMARELASPDSGMEIRPVDMTVLIGRDLSYPGLVPGVFMRDTAAVGETIFVDVVNQGLQYTLDGQGPATWLAGALDGRTVTLGGNDYIMAISDIRDGDRQPDEGTGIPALLDSTVFLYRSNSGIMPELEGRLRSFVQALPDIVAGPPQGVPVPDLWVLLGSREGTR